jgi:hypothetical protein
MRRVNQLVIGASIGVPGALFIVVMLWAPRGLAGLVGQARDVLARRRPVVAPAAQAEQIPAEVRV